MKCKSGDTGAGGLSVRNDPVIRFSNKILTVWSGDNNRNCLLKNLREAKIKASFHRGYNIGSISYHTVCCVITCLRYYFSLL